MNIPDILHRDLICADVDFRSRHGATTSEKAQACAKPVTFECRDGSGACTCTHAATKDRGTHEGVFVAIILQAHNTAARSDCPIDFFQYCDVLRSTKAYEIVAAGTVAILEQDQTILDGVCCSRTNIFMGAEYWGWHKYHP